MLPQPSEGFAWVQASSRHALVCTALQPLAAHLFTTRPWMLGSPTTAREAGWREVAAALDVQDEALVRVQQVHRADLRRAWESQPPEADLIVSRIGSPACAVQAADCVPLLIADRAIGAVAAVHSGWRGMVLGAAARGVEALKREFGSEPRDLVAAVGPSIGACCYEVGREVRDAFAGAGADDLQLARWFHDAPQPSAQNLSMPQLRADRRPDHWFFDGWRVVSDQLERAGVPAPQIHVARLCTASHPDVFCSSRRDGAAAGRQVAAIVPRTRS